MDFLTVLALLAFGCLFQYFGIRRLVQIVRDLADGSLISRDPVLGVLGFLGVALLAIAILAVWTTAFITFFGMRSGSASGVPFGIALFGFPFAHALSELLVRCGYKES
jgi:hypothetical protein